MKKNFKTIKVDINEEITSVVDRMIECKEKNVVLAVPKDANIFQNIINIKLLRREADNLNKDIALVTHDPIGQKMAEQAGILTLSDMEESIYDSEYGLPKKDLIYNEDEEKKIKKISDIRGIPKSSFYDSEKKEEFIEAEEGIDSSDISRVKKTSGEYEIEPPLKKQDGYFLRKQKEKDNILHKLWNAKKPSGFEKIKKRDRKLLSPMFLVMIFGIASILAVVIAFSFIFQSAEIVIDVKKEEIISSRPVIASVALNDISLSEYKIPAKEFVLEKILSKEFDATGTSSAAEKARGRIKIYNNFSASPQTLVATTRFLSKEGKLFRLVNTTIVPPATIAEGKIVASYIIADVVADQYGEEYNIGPTVFSIPGFLGTPKYQGFYGQSESYMAGGSAPGQRSIATKDDIEKADSVMRNELRAILNDNFVAYVNTLGEDYQISDTSKSISISSNNELKVIGNKFVLEYKGVLKSIGFKKNDLVELISRDVFAQSRGENNLIKESIKINYENIVTSVDKGQISFVAKFEGRAQRFIDKDLLIDKIAGVSEQNLNNILSAEPIENATASFRPFWIRSVPSNKSKIKIFIK